ncbi:uncharacterized protein TNCV_3813531 [Trichonephila clavipes]|nr:uncharacterized protein TNCV_3813531 [Trichonephila clavipes]
MFALGKELRKRYNHFITGNPREITVQAAVHPKNKRSGLSLLASLYAPTEFWEFIPGLPWQPVPIFYIGGNQDKVRISFFSYGYGDRFNSCQVIYSQFGLAIHQNEHQARRRFVEWAQNEIAVVPDFHKRVLFSDEAHFWLNGYVNKQNCRIWNEANPQVYVETPLHPEKLTVWCALWAGGILLQKR